MQYSRDKEAYTLELVSLQKILADDEDCPEGYEMFGGRVAVKDKNYRKMVDGFRRGYETKSRTLKGAMGLLMTTAQYGIYGGSRALMDNPETKPLKLALDGNVALHHYHIFVLIHWSKYIKILGIINFMVLNTCTLSPNKTYRT